MTKVNETVLLKQQIKELQKQVRHGERLNEKVTKVLFNLTLLDDYLSDREIKTVKMLSKCIVEYEKKMYPL